ncbi:MAG: DUF4139 domain-containing protein [Phycisphaerae bacterium]
MSQLRIMLGVLLLGAGAASPTPAADAPRSATALTIYSSAQPGAIPADWYRPLPESIGGPPQTPRLPGYAVVKQERPIEIKAGRDTIRFSDVAALIDPTTVTFESLSDSKGTRVLDQNYQFDLVSSAKLMERYIDRPITVERVEGDHVSTTTGTLLSTQGGLVLRTADGVQVINGYSNVRFPDLPGGLITRPTLVWDVESAGGGTQPTRVSYQTGGMTWWADYNVVFSEGKDANSGALDVGAWVSIINQCGASFDDAKLKLVAGEVHRAQQQADFGAPESKLAMGRVTGGGFVEKAFFEYHLYTLGRPVTLPQNSTKQIELFPVARGVPCEKVLVYYGLGSRFLGSFADPVTDRSYGGGGNKKVDVYLRFRNDEKSGLGIPLPAGRIRVSKRDPADQSLEFIGEDTIDHTPRDERVQIALGTAFDVVGERRQADFRVDTSRRTIDEKIEIELRNQKSEPVKVIVKENLYRWVNWEITAKSHAFEKTDSRTIEFPVTVAPGRPLKLSYTVHYSW